MCEALRQNSVLRYRVAEAAKRAHHADKARQNERKEREHKNGYAHISHIVIRGIECGQTLYTLKLIEAAYIVEPARAALRIGGNAHQNYKYVKRSRDIKRDNEHPEHISVLEAVLRSGVRNALEADKRPRGDKRDPHYLTDGAVARYEVRLHTVSGAAESNHRGDETDRNADSEDKREYDHTVRCRLLALGAQQRHKQDRGERNKRLAEIDLISENRVEVAEAEHTPEEVARKERYARRICPEDGYVDKEEEPRHKKRAVIAEYILNVVVDASGAGISVRKEVVVICDQDHHYESDKQT